MVSKPHGKKTLYKLYCKNCKFQAPTFSKSIKRARKEWNNISDFLERDTYYNQTGIICDDCDIKPVCWSYPNTSKTCSNYKNMKKDKIRNYIDYLESEGYTVTKNEEE